MKYTSAVNATGCSRFLLSVNKFTCVKKIYLAIELLLAFIGLPLAIYLKIMPLPKFAILIGLSCFALFIMIYEKHVQNRMFLRWHLKGVNFHGILKRTVIFGALMYLLTIILNPHNLFALPKTDPLLWLSTAIFYPLVSAFPQEILYRTFFFYRYKTLLSSDKMIVLLSIISFGFMHIIYHNVIALILTFAGGYCFCETYRRSGSLLIVAIEHSIYGFIVFTVGLGEVYFM